MSDLLARQAESEDFHEYDYVVAMDQDNYHALSAICPPGLEDKLYLLMDFAPQMRTREVPDPYYGGAKGFERVFELVEAGSRGLLQEIQRRHL
jgi:protein-tyrosine phosphatase